MGIYYINFLFRIHDLAKWFRRSRQKALSKAACEGNVRKLESLLARGADAFGGIYGSGYSPGMYAAANRNGNGEEILKLLFAKARYLGSSSVTIEIEECPDSIHILIDAMDVALGLTELTSELQPNIVSLLLEHDSKSIKFRDWNAYVYACNFCKDRVDRLKVAAESFPEIWTYIAEIVENDSSHAREAEKFLKAAGQSKLLKAARIEGDKVRKADKKERIRTDKVRKADKREREEKNSQSFIIESFLRHLRITGDDWDVTNSDDLRTIKILGLGQLAANRMIKDFGRYELSGERKNIVRALGDLGSKHLGINKDPAVRLLIKVLLTSGEDVWVRAEAALAVRLIGAKEVVQDLSAALKIAYLDSSKPENMYSSSNEAAYRGLIAEIDQAIKALQK